MAYFNCKARLEQAAGKALTDDELQDIFERINRAANDIKAGRNTPPAGRTGLAGVIDAVSQEAAAQKVAEAERAERNTAMQVVKLSTNWANVQEGVKAGLSPLDALSRLIVNRADGRMNVQSLESRYAGIATDMKRRIQDTWLALGNDFLGFVQDKEKVQLLIRELRGENTGDAMAKKGAQAWRNMAEEFRRRFNDGGGNIGKLEDWAFPQHHSQELVARAGEQVWIDAVTPLLDRARYVDDAGTAWTQDRLRNFLSHAYKTISTNGYANIDPGQFKGTGARANRHAEERQIHFKDADAYMQYWQSFGERTFPDILMGHVESLAKDIAFVEHFGPNADASYRTMRDMAVKDMATADPTKLGQVDKAAIRLDKQWNVASGRALPVASAALAQTFDTLRNLAVAGKLGSAFWASFFGDKVMMEAVSHLNNLPMIDRWTNEMRMLNPLNGGERAMLQRQGLMLEYMQSAMSQWGEAYGNSSWSGKIASAVMRVSGMNAINEWRRGAFSLTLMGALGEKLGMDYGKIRGTDMHLLKSYGIKKRDWEIFQLAGTDDLGHGINGLTPDAIMRITDDQLKSKNLIAQADDGAEATLLRQEAVTKLLGAVNSESKMAVVEPGWRERAQLFGNIQRGTMSGELTKAFWQFKTFPIAQFERMWDLAMSRPTAASKAATLAAMMTMMAVTGAMIIQTREMLAGKDPRPVNDPDKMVKFGLASFLQGGALGVYGDFLYQMNQTRYGTGPLELMAGPTVGSALDFLTSTMNAGRKEYEGKGETHLLAKYMTLGKGFIPGNNLWYTKAAMDHLIFQNIQENLSPGYLATMQAKSLKEYGQDWWWKPGQGSPDRAPNVGQAFGQ